MLNFHLVWNTSRYERLYVCLFVFMVLFCSSFGSRSERPRALQQMLIRLCPMWEGLLLLYQNFLFSRKKRRLTTNLGASSVRIRDAWETDVWCQTKSPGYSAVFTKAKTRANAGRRRTVLFLGRIFERFKICQISKNCTWTLQSHKVDLKKT